MSPLVLGRDVRPRGLASASRGQNFVASASAVLASASRVLASASRVWPRRGRSRGDNNNTYDIYILNCCIDLPLTKSTVLT